MGLTTIIVLHDQSVSNVRSVLWPPLCSTCGVVLQDMTSVLSTISNNSQRQSKPADSLALQSSMPRLC